MLTVMLSRQSITMSYDCGMQYTALSFDLDGPLFLYYKTLITDICDKSTQKIWFLEFLLLIKCRLKFFYVCAFDFN